MESAETQDCVSAPQLTCHLEQKMEAEDEKNEPNFVPSAVSEPRWALHMGGDKCRAKGFKFLEIAPHRVRRRKRIAHD